MSLAKPKIKFETQHLKLIQQNFDLLDDNKRGKIDSEQFSILYRALGQTISERELDKIKEEYFKESKDQSPASTSAVGKPPAHTKATKEPVKPSAPAGLAAKTPVAGKKVEGTPPKASGEPPPDTPGATLEQFINAFASNYKAPINETVLRQAFQVFDPDNSGKMAVNDFVDLMTKRGETLPKNELDELLMLANVDATKKDFDYAALAQKLCEGPSGIRSI